MNCELVVFDMAGTTVYDGDAVNTSLRGALNAASVPVVRDEVNAVMGITKPVAIEILLKKAGIPEADLRDKVNQIYGDFLTRMRAYYQTDPAVHEVEGAVATFRQLRAQGIKVALDTGFSRSIADVVLDRLGWIRDGLVDTTITADEVENGRPAPDMIFAAMKQVGITDASRVAKVGDTPSDLQEGEAARCGWIIGVTEGSHTREELLPYPHTHLIGTVAELPALLKNS